MRVAGAIFVVGTLSLWGSLSSAADPAKDAEELITKGVELRRHGQTAEALELFVKAHALDPSARALAQLGSAEFALHHVVDAEAHLDQALARHDSPWIENPKNRETLEKILADARRQVARVHLRGTPGAEVSIDGKRAGVLPLDAPVHVAAGTVRIRGTAPGRRPFEKELVVAGGDDTTASVDLEVLPPVPAVSPATTLVVSPPPSAPPTGRPAWRMWTGGALIAGGLAAGATGVGWLAVNGHVTCATTPPGAVCEQLYDTKSQGWAAVVAGAVVAGAGATLLLWPGNERTVGVSAGPGSLALSGRF